MRLNAVMLICAVAGCGGGGTTTPPDMAMARDLAMAPDMAKAQPDMAMQTSCDPIAQDCVSMSNPKCAIVDDGTGMNNLVTQCEPLMGMKMAGDACTRTGMGNAGIGIDDCDKGLFCSGNGPLLNPVVRHCKKICGADKDCGADKCLQLTAGVPPFGICITPCAPLGTDCGANTCASILPDVDGLNIFFQCRMAGAGGAGANCMTNGDLDCQADFVCLNLTGMMGGTPTCAQLCDMTHACPAMKTCKPVQGLMFGNGGGVCQ